MTTIVCPSPSALRVAMARAMEQPVLWMRDKELTAARRRYCPRTSGAAPLR